VSVSKKNQTSDPKSWLSQESLKIQRLLNLARGAHPINDWPPPEDYWRARWDALKAAIDSGELLGSPKRLPAHGNTAVKLKDVWAFVSKREEDKSWDWLRDSCQRWAGVRDVSLAAGDNDTDQPEHVRSQSARRSDREHDALLENKIKKVLTKAKKEWPDPMKRPGIKPMADELVRKYGKELGYKKSAIRQILDGSYKASRSLEISGL
jgi:hypothetical protein